MYDEKHCTLNKKKHAIKIKQPVREIVTKTRRIVKTVAMSPLESIFKTKYLDLSKI